MSPIVSVLIPVYNAGKYLPECLQSIQAQTFSDFEIICIDDGSTDNSSTILQKFAHKEQRLKIVTQKNAGVAITRNRLMQLAKGEYIAFVDADDIISSTYLETLVHAAKQTNADITKCFFQEISENGKQIFPAHFSKKFYKEPTSDLATRFMCGYYDSVVCGKLFRHAWIIQKQLSFLEGRIAEDQPFVVMCFLQANVITKVNQTLYSYRKGLSNCITANSQQMIVDKLKNSLDLQNNIRACGLWTPSVMSQWIKIIVRRLSAFHKIAGRNTEPLLKLQLQAFENITKIILEAPWYAYWRWRIMIKLINLCGWKSVYVWTKIFR